MNKTKKYLLILGINIIIMLFLLKIVDLFFQQEEPEFQLYERQLSLTEHPANADYSASPPDYRMEQVQNLEKKEYRLRTDGNGLIIGPSDIDRLEDPIDIMFLGGSTTECFFVEEDKRFPYMVGELLTLETGKRITVRNAGLMGKHSMKSNFDLMVRGIQLKPDVVVLMHNINDLVQLLYVNSYYDGPLTRRIVGDQQKTGNSRGWLYTTAFYVKEWIFPNIYRIISEKIRNDDAGFDEWEGWRANQDVYVDDVKGKFINSLTTFISIARANGMNPVLMTQFNRIDIQDEFIVENYYKNAEYGIPPDLFFDFYHIFNQALRETADNEGVLLIDLAENIPSSSEYMYDAVHLNTQGSILVADIIADSIKTTFYN